MLRRYETGISEEESGFLLFRSPISEKFKSGRWNQILIPMLPPRVTQSDLHTGGLAGGSFPQRLQAYSASYIYSNCKRYGLNLDVTDFYMPVYGHFCISGIRPGVYAGLEGRNALIVSLVYEAPEFAFTV
jgi:hypothetical protein